MSNPVCSIFIHEKKYSSKTHKISEIKQKIDIYFVCDIIIILEGNTNYLTL